VWGAIAFDGTHLIFGTGNTCDSPVPTANGAVELSLDGKVLWNFVAVQNAYTDDDTGGAVMLSDGRAVFINKNGTLYSLGQGSGTMQWATALGAPDGFGGFASPSTDGSTIVVGAGLFSTGPASATFEDGLPAAGQPNDVFAGKNSRLDGLDANGVVRWTDTMKNRITGDVAIVNGMAFAGLDKNVKALDLDSGKPIWNFPTGGYIDASPIVVPSGIYAADDAGNVYAFSLP
jgi:outer membrane protein assembly factor BamB